MPTKRIIHERDAYKWDKRFHVAQAYSFEGQVFWGLFPSLDPNRTRGQLTRERATELIDQAYKRFAPKRIRPKVWWMRYKKERPAGGGSYSPVTHHIWLPEGYSDENIVLHEVAHSLTWKQSWTGHGPYFLRALIELHCWYCRLPVDYVVRIATEEHGLDVADKFVLGDDPTRVRWIRRPR